MVFKYQCCRECAPTVRRALQAACPGARIDEDNRGSKITFELSIGNPAKAPKGSLVQMAFDALKRSAPHGIKGIRPKDGIFKCDKS
ncbi:hypothetical protein VSDG_02868 [Cytospora chrysosperma]|uniref:HMA domain-containing protein n=1 Tax=Cytospora chrysosperma TaxID=252740 RepID=A0A423WCT5_CYTCH|nr:hypothetical protein VSDG_02868 [Valsa sordida]